MIKVPKIKMPECCWRCPFTFERKIETFYYCEPCNNYFYKQKWDDENNLIFDWKTSRHPECPLEEEEEEESCSYS